MITQSIRCYTPVDFLLLQETGLAPECFEVEGTPIEIEGEHASGPGPLWDVFDYRVTLVHRAQTR
jgi:hypothetical protein